MRIRARTITVESQSARLIFRAIALDRSGLSKNRVGKALDARVSFLQLSEVNSTRLNAELIIAVKLACTRLRFLRLLAGHDTFVQMERRVHNNSWQLVTLCAPDR